MLRRIFPNEYDLDEIKKHKASRAFQFPDSRDAFQQLVGDALRFTFGNSAFISKTAGQDGSIDSYIENYSEGLDSPFEHLEQPIIIECKSHQLSIKLDENIEHEWRKVRKKLTEQAENGWKNLFAPWENAKSYVYCISANSSSKEFHKKLQGKIEDFFSSLPLENRPPIEKVQVLDWGTLRHWFNDIPKLCDLWLGIDSSQIIEHNNFKNSLGGFKRFLLSDELNFVEPEPDAQYHPRKIFERLKSNESKNNVLITGAGGVGKTRTSTEVAELAEQEGWRILHVLAGEPEVENEDLAQAVLPYSGKTLVVCDYIDQMNKLDLGYIRRTLIPIAKERGNELAVLGNSRPGWMKLANPERDELFYEIELKPSQSQREKITEKIIDDIAPKACEKLGRDLVKELCGERSIIALLIALELERRATSRGIRKEEVVDIRQGDLVAWLRKRLGEDGFVATQDKHGMAQPESWLIISAAVLACAPEKRDFFLDVADEVKRATGANVNSEFIVDTLVDLGWLEWASGFFSTPHDVVADEVFDQAIHFERYVHQESMRQVLASSVSYPRSLGRFATAFERVLGAIQEEDIYQRIKQEAGNWLSENADELGKSLASTNSDVSSYSIGAVLSGNLWRDVALDKWSELVNPWLNQHRTEKEARHLVYKGLKKIRSIEKINLLKIAQDWLEKYVKEPEANYILGPVLARKELAGEQAAKAIEYALIWLETDDNYLKSGAQFVFNQLLTRKELTKEQAEKAIEYTLVWLETDDNYLKVAAGFVLPSLFERKELRKEQAEKAIKCAFLWLENDDNYLKLDTQFVYKQLLSRKELGKEDAEKAIEYALAWLEADDNYLKVAAGFVLPSLFERKELRKEQAERVIRYALVWLETDDNYLRLDAQFVYGNLIERKEFGKEQAEKAIEYTLIWLETDDNYLKLTAGFILPTLFERKELRKWQAEKAIQYTFLWLENDDNYLKLETQFVYKQLLSRKELGKEQAEKAIEYALAWLEADDNYLKLDAGFVLPSLLSKITDFDDRANDLIQKSIQWLKEYVDTQDAEFVIKKLFKRMDVDSQTIKNLIRATLNRLENRLNDEEATYLIRWCLQPRIDDPDLNVERIKLGILWLRANEQKKNADFVWNKILRNPFTTNEDWKYTSELAFQWFKTKNITEKGVISTINGLLPRPHLLSEENFRYLIERGLDWIITSEQNQTAGTDIKATYKFIKWALENFPEEFQLNDLVLQFNEITEQKKNRYKFYLVSQRIDELLEDTNLVDISEIREMCEIIEKQSKYSIRSTNYIIAPFLALGLRSEKEIFDVIKKTVEPLILSQEAAEMNKRKIKLVFSTVLRQHSFVLLPEQKEWLEKMGINPILQKK